MDRFRKSNLKDLLAHQAQPCLSLYMPTVRAGAEIQQNPIRFKKLLDEAEERLCEAGLRRPEAQELLEKAREEMLMKDTFWRQQSDGLALFIAPDLFRYYRLPLAFEGIVTVEDHFYLKPLFELFQTEGRFYVLALSKGQVRFLEGTKYQVREIELEDVPPSLAEALKWDDPEKQLQSHPVSRGRQEGEPGPTNMTFHGHGVGTDDEKTNVLRYFRKLDRGVSDFLAEERAPLVLAGVEYLFPIYQEANSYNYLVEEGIPGNPEDLSNESLHARAWDLVEPFFRKEQKEAANLYRLETGRDSELASEDITEIIPSAYSGQVGQLFVRTGVELWGRYDLGQNQVRVHSERKEDSQDLLNLAIRYTFQNNGAVYVLEAGRMPTESPLAAVFRY
jgi:hypothetical protein